MTPADELRQAAQHIRKLADAATPGPWGVGNGTNVAREVEQLSLGSYSAIQTVAETDYFGRDEEGDEDTPGYVEIDAEDDAAHIALWDPPTALLVADWLEKRAKPLDIIDGNAQKFLVGDRENATLDPALALARAINAKSAAEAPEGTQPEVGA